MQTECCYASQSSWQRTVFMCKAQPEWHVCMAMHGGLG